MITRFTISAKRTAVFIFGALMLAGWWTEVSRASSPPDFRPDPLSVRRYGAGYRYPQAGWIVLHIEGEPYERGVQHGRLMATEIVAYMRCFGAVQSPKAPADGWKSLRTLVNALFLRRYNKEYMEEMKGIAEGATAAGARFEDRPIDLVDIVAINVWPEIETLESALEATATGFEGVRFPKNQPRAMPAPKPMHCSAFAATGRATADGKIVFGHISMFLLYPSLYFNVWLDVKPAKGHRVVMQSYPGGIQSGMDYYLNDVGLLVSETTLAQTHFDIKGLSVASRIRQALQYADNIDKAVEILKDSNNGLYTNEWLLADIKTNEIAMFELGTHKSKLYRSSKNEWFGGTEGFYWGCNNTKDLDVRLETIPGVKGRPANMVWKPSDRDKTWLRLYAKYKGKIDADFGKEAFTTPPLAGYPSLDAKFTTSAMAKELKTWALYGPPLGRSWQPTEEERTKYPEIRAMVSNPWTVLHPLPPPKAMNSVKIVDLPDEADNKAVTFVKEEEKPLHTVAAWHGTILPKSDADVWLAAAFADYEKYVAHETARKEHGENHTMTAADRDRLALELFARRSEYLAAARAGFDVPLARTRAEGGGDEWYRVAAGKGFLLLHDLRQMLGDEMFTRTMDSFGRENAGKAVTTAQFQAHVEKASGKPLEQFFAYWLKETGLPLLELGAVKDVAKEDKFTVEVEIRRSGPKVPCPVEITVETAKGETTKTVTLDADHSKFTIQTSDRPLRVVADKYGKATRGNGGAFSVLSFHHELEDALIVYGTTDEVATNREAALALQGCIREHWSNITVPVKADREVMDGDLKNRHLVLVGRPDSNTLVERFKEMLPIAFGPRSFSARGETFAHTGSAVIAAGDNPLNKRFSLVVVAGLGGESTLRAAKQLLGPGDLLGKNHPRGDVLLLPNNSKPRSLALPARDLMREAAAVK